MKRKKMNCLNGLQNMENTCLFRRTFVKSVCGQGYTSSICWLILYICKMPFYARCMPNYVAYTHNRCVLSTLCNVMIVFLVRQIKSLVAKPSYVYGT